MDLTLFYENVYTLAKREGIKISRIEEALDVHAGYLSRCRRNKINIGINFAYTIAKMLGVPIEELIEQDFKMEKRKEYLISSIASMQRELSDIESKETFGDLPF